MSVFNQNRSSIIQIIFVAIFIIITLQLLNLQIFSSQYKIMANNNAIVRKVIYPARGIIYDRKNKSLLDNKIMYDLVVTPVEIKGIDTLSFCELVKIDTIEFKKRIRKIIIKNGNGFKQGTFESLLSDEKFARLTENINQFPGFSLVERNVRVYPSGAAGNILGYIAEVDTGYLRRHKDEGYEMGDYAGLTGLERTYEKVLMGNRGVKRLIRDKNSKNLGDFENGEYDTLPTAGKSLYSSIDLELQKLGEKLMGNKVGSIVAIDPRTGGILCMVSAPTYNPNDLTGSDRRKHFAEMFNDPRQALQNRPVSNTYSPGSTFKTFVGIVGMNESIINDRYTVSCGGAYYGCRRMGCHAAGTFNLKPAIAMSCNSYFATVFRKILDSDTYPTRDSALNKFNEYAYSFGMGQRLGIDLPNEKKGNIPTSNYYKGIHGPKWMSCNIVSNSIGQGEVTTTLTQLANVMAIIANKGWYYTPHLIDSIENGDEFEALANYKIKHKTLPIADSIFEEVHAGMQQTVESGTATQMKIEDITFCAKTGTVENTLKGVKLKDHSFFGAFAPRNNPKIAIAVMCENAGFGATVAGPIASLLIEKYLKDSITNKNRLAEIERVSNLKIIPSYMQEAINKKNAEKQAKLDSLNELAMEKEKETDENELEKNIILPKKPINNKPENNTIKDSIAILKREDEE